jgi:hypothetical protein
MDTDEKRSYGQRLDPVAAKEVKVWTWRRMLRDHSPLPASTLLTMYVLSTYMDADGYTFVGQARIAEGARASVRTVQRHLETAMRLGWLRVQLTRVASRDSPHTSFKNNYWACVPEDLELSAVDNELRDDVGSQSDDSAEGGDTAMSSPRCFTVERDDTETIRCRHPEAEGDDKSAEGCDTAMSQELFNGTLNRTLQEGALVSALAVDRSTRTKNQELTHVSTVLPNLAVANQEVLQEKAVGPPPAPQPSPEPPAPTIEERIAKVLSLCPTLNDHGVARMVQGATPDAVAAVRSKLVV